MPTSSRLPGPACSARPLVLVDHLPGRVARLAFAVSRQRAPHARTSSTARTRTTCRASTWGRRRAGPDGVAAESPRVSARVDPLAAVRCRASGGGESAGVTRFPHSITLTFFTLVRSSCSFSLLVHRREVLHGARHVVDLVVPALQLRVSFRAGARVRGSPARGNTRPASRRTAPLTAECTARARSRGATRPGACRSPRTARSTTRESELRRESLPKAPRGARR